MDSKDIDSALETLRKVKSESSKDLNFGFDLNWNDFIKIMQFLSPKSFGTRIQNRVILKNNFRKLKPSEDRGDFEVNGNFYEFKSTILNTSNTLANFVGIRPYQNVDGYFLIVVDTNTNPYKTHSYHLTSEEMREEIELLNANPTNGTKEANKLNQNISYRFSIDFNTQNHNTERWENYRTTELIL